MPGAESRLAEVAGLIDLMEKRGVLSLRVGDIELTRSAAPHVPPMDEESGTFKGTQSEIELRRQYKRISLGATSRVVERVG